MACRKLTTASRRDGRIFADFRGSTVLPRLERRLLLCPVQMLTWTELAAYLFVVAAVCGGGMAACWAFLWRQ